MRRMTVPDARSITSTVPLPSSATNRRLRARSTARWSIRPVTPFNAIVRSSTTGGGTSAVRPPPTMQTRAARMAMRCLFGNTKPVSCERY